MKTIAIRLADCGGRPAGFDYLRIFLACAIFVFHCFSAGRGEAYLDGLRGSFFRPVLAMLVPMFFCLSGFLVSGALERSRSMVSFLGMRVLRIYPALIAEVILSALVLGPLVTTYPLGAYFSDPLFASYLLNTLGYVHFYLPGVFQHLPGSAQVNAQLWTVPFELECYATIAVLAVLGIARRRRLLLGVLVAIHAVWAWRVYAGAPLAHLTLAPVTIWPRGLVFCFLWGVVLYAYRDKVRWNLPLGLLSLVLTWSCLLYWPLDGVAIVPLSYLTIAIGLTNPRRTKVLEHGDYSYGIYLFGNPIQQGIAALGPWAWSFWIVLLLSGPLTALFAAGSWHLLEKHVLAQRPRLIRLEAAYLKRRAGLGAFLKRRGAGTTPRPETMLSR